MPNIHELNERRAKLCRDVQYLGMANTPSDLDAFVKADAQYRLVRDAWLKAEQEYTDALANMTAEELEQLVNTPKEQKES